MNSNGPWVAYPPRQLTGTGFVYHAYVGRGRPEITCGHDHRKAIPAAICAKRLAKQLNRAAIAKATEEEPC